MPAGLWEVFNLFYLNGSKSFGRAFCFSDLYLYFIDCVYAMCYHSTQKQSPSGCVESRCTFCIHIFVQNIYNQYKHCSQNFNKRLMIFHVPISKVTTFVISFHLLSPISCHCIATIFANQPRSWVNRCARWPKGTKRIHEGIKRGSHQLVGNELSPARWTFNDVQWHRWRCRWQF